MFSEKRNISDIRSLVCYMVNGVMDKNNLKDLFLKLEKKDEVSLMIILSSLRREHKEPSMVDKIRKEMMSFINSIDNIAIAA